jgi:hypothetical protein
VNFFAKSLRIWSRESLTANKACCDELMGERGRKTASQGHKIMIHGVDENGGGSDGQRVARVETSLDSLPRYPQGRPHCNQGHKSIIPFHEMEFVHLLALPPRQRILCVFRFIIEYSSLRDFYRPLGNNNNNRSIYFYMRIFET